MDDIWNQNLSNHVGFIDQETLAGPKKPVDLNTTMGDCELFEAAFLSSPLDGFADMGDPWSDVTWLILSCNFQFIHII